MTSDNTPAEESARTRNFIEEAIDEDLAGKRCSPSIHTRYPPEPNGCLHIGHAKAILINYGIATRYGGSFNLRFDDTNPLTEETHYVDAIQADLKWLGADWEDRLFYASDYFEKLYELARKLVSSGLAYVCDLDGESIRKTRGTLKEPGEESPFRSRSVEENLDLFERMRNGEFGNGEKTLRAKIDMASPNLNMRDPVLYRIIHATHHRTGDAWCIYPTYDFAHGQSDAIEGITHSLCSIEFENHRPLYDWLIEKLGLHRSRQIEFARLNLTYTVMSKRFLKRLVDEGHVQGWDDPRMPTLSGLRRRGYTPASIRAFCERIGVSKVPSTIEPVVLEQSIREELNLTAPRRMGVLDPLKVTVTNWPSGKTDELDAVNNPEDASAGSRKVPFTGTFLIERGDFMEDPPRKFFRLAPGREVRLRYAYLFTCTEAVKNGEGEVVELKGTVDPDSRGGNAPDGRKVKGTIHWVSADHAIRAEVRLYDNLFRVEDPLRSEGEGTSFVDLLNPESRIVRTGHLEPSLAEATPGQRFQFERLGYFCTDAVDHRPDGPVFNRTVTLRDSWARIKKNASQVK